MGFTKYVAPHAGGRAGRRPFSEVRIAQRAGKPTWIAIPASIYGAVSDGDTVDVLLGDGEDAGAIAVTAGTAHRTRSRAGRATTVCCKAAILAACAGKPHCRAPRYELRDGMLVVWPAQEAVVPGE